jgi:hypothetical protein
MAIWPSLDDEVWHNRRNGTEQEEETEEAVHLTRREKHLGADDAPDDRRSVEYLCACTHKVVRLLRVTHVRNVLKHPGLNSELDNTCDHSRDDLAPEHRAWADEVLRWRSMEPGIRRTEFSCSDLASYPR